MGAELTQQGFLVLTSDVHECAAAIVPAADECLCKRRSGND